MSSMSDATRRALRTLIQVAIALLTLAPVLHQALDWLAGIVGADNPVVTWGLAILAGATAVTGLINRLEEAGIIPAWLKGVPELPPNQESSAGRTWPS